MNLAEHLSSRRSPSLHRTTYDQELNAVSRGKRVWAVFAALAAALLALQLFTHTAPMAVAHAQETTTSQGEAAVCGDAHGSEEMSEHRLTRDRQRADEYAPDGPSYSSSQVMDADAVVASPTISAARDTLRPSRPVTDLSPAALQVFRC